MLTLLKCFSIKSKQIPIIEVYLTNYSRLIHLQSNTCLALDNYSMYNYVSHHKKCKQITKVVEQSPKNTGNQTHIFYVNYNNIVQISIFGVNI